MEIHENGYRFRNNYKWEDLKNQPYNYAQEGLVKHLLSHKIIESKNKVLQFILKYYEGSIIYFFKAADYLKNFKNYNWKN
jgi:hypothetical protein